MCVCVCSCRLFNGPCIAHDTLPLSSSCNLMHSIHRRDNNKWKFQYTQSVCERERILRLKKCALVKNASRQSVAYPLKHLAMPKSVQTVICLVVNDMHFILQKTNDEHQQTNESTAERSQKWKKMERFAASEWRLPNTLNDEWHLPFAIRCI